MSIVDWHRKPVADFFSRVVSDLSLTRSRDMLRLAQIVALI
jgi:hypothetical protein